MWWLWWLWFGHLCSETCLCRYECTVHLVMGAMSLWTGPRKVYPSSQLSRPTAGTCRCGNTATSPTVDELNHVIDHRHLSLHTTGMQQPVHNSTSCTVGLQLGKLCGEDHENLHLRHDRDDDELHCGTRLS